MSILRYAVSAGLSKVFVAIAPLVTTPLMLSYLGVRDYGIWMVLVSVTTMLSVADLGVANGITNTLVRERGNDTTAHSIISNAYIVLALISLVMASVASLPLLLWCLGLSKFNSAGAVEIMLAAVFIPFSLNIVLGLIQRILYIDNCAIAANALSVASAFTSIGAAYFAVKLDAGIGPSIFLFSLSSTLVYAVATVYYYAFWRTNWRPRLSAFKANVAKEIIKSGRWFLLLSMLVLVSGQVDYLIIAAVVGADDVASYSIANRLIGIANSVVTVLGTALWPIFAEAIQKGRIKWLRSSIRRMNLAAFAVYFVFASCLMLGFADLTKLWLGASLAISNSILLHLVGGSFLVALMSPYFMVLNSVLDLKSQLKAYLLLTVVSVNLKIVLGEQFGVAAVAAVGFYSWLIIMAPYIFYRASRHLKVPL